MALKESEAIVLRSYPLREADLLVTFFTRVEGKVKGVARAAKKSKKRFGGALEPLTQVRVYYDDREGHELARIDSCDVLDSPLSSAVDYPRAVALGHVAEMLDELLPEREANDAIYRLAVAVLGQLSNQYPVLSTQLKDKTAATAETAIWMPLTYFDIWIARLTGFLPELGACVECGEALDGRAWFHAMVDGLMCPTHKRLASSELSRESREIAAEMFRKPVDTFAGEAWPREKGADLRKMVLQLIQRHIDKQIVTGTMLARL